MRGLRTTCSRFRHAVGTASNSGHGLEDTWQTFARGSARHRSILALVVDTPNVQSDTTLVRAVKPLGSAWYRFILMLAGWAFWLLGGIRVIGRENVPMHGPVLVTANHLSHLDPPLTAVAVRRALNFMAKDGLFRVPLLGWLIRSVGAFPVRRGENDSESIRRAIELLKEGLAVLIFPEGTRGDARTLGEISPGVAMLAKRANAVVLPVAVVGTNQSLPRGASWPRRRRLFVRIGKPFRYDEAATGNSERERRESFARYLSLRLVELCREEGLNLKIADSR